MVNDADKDIRDGNVTRHGSMEELIADLDDLPGKLLKLVRELHSPTGPPLTTFRLLEAGFPEGPTPDRNRLQCDTALQELARRKLISFDKDGGIVPEHHPVAAEPVSPQLPLLEALLLTLARQMYQQQQEYMGQPLTKKMLFDDATAELPEGPLKRLQQHHCDLALDELINKKLITYKGRGVIVPAY